MTRDTVAKGDGKRDRQRLVAALLVERVVETQAELVVILRSMGCPVTQSSVARDFAEMKVQKVRALYGRSRYVLPQQQSPSPEGHAISALHSFCTGIQVAGTVAIVSTSVGAAGTVGTAIDALHHPDVIGSVAGYDTIALFCSDAEKAEAVRDHLQALRRSREAAFTT